jgi:acetylornithine deacetylase/succinyl-diaminopimelate desuccinylase-like protein
METILRQLIAYQTMAGNQLAMHQLLDYVAGFLAARGMHVEWFESDGIESIVATVKQGNKTPKILLAAHADVVPADESEFVMQAADERYYGRGALDMKFAIAAYMQLVDTLHDNGQLADTDLGIMITTDEERGGRNGVGKLVDEGYIPNVCILPDGGDNWHIQTASKGFWAFEISMAGTSVHGSRHWQGDNAITKLLAVYDEIALLFPAEQGKHTNSISLTQLNGGVAMNQVPSQAVMSIDVRSTDRAEHIRLYDSITAICHKHSATYQHISDCTPTTSDLSDPMIKPFAELVTKHTGVEQSGFYAMGASDIRFYVPFGVPCISVYPEGGNLHANGEWVSIAALDQFSAILHEYVSSLT